jgi:Fe-S oxidoreductase
MSDTLVHVLNGSVAGGEHSYCGYAMEVSEDMGEHHDVFASNAENQGVYSMPRPGLVVTCPHCCDAIHRQRLETEGLILRPRRR